MFGAPSTTSSANNPIAIDKPSISFDFYWNGTLAIDKRITLEIHVNSQLYGNIFIFPDTESIFPYPLNIACNGERMILKDLNTAKSMVLKAVCRQHEGPWSEVLCNLDVKSFQSGKHYSVLLTKKLECIVEEEGACKTASYMTSNYTIFRTSATTACASATSATITAASAPATNASTSATNTNSMFTRKKTNSDDETNDQIKQLLGDLSFG